MNNVKLDLKNVKLKRRNVKTLLLQGPGTRAYLGEIAGEICDTANAMSTDNLYMIQNIYGRNRASARVKTKNRHGVNSNAKYNTLLKALGSVKK